MEGANMKFDIKQIDIDGVAPGTPARWNSAANEFRAQNDKLQQFFHAYSPLAAVTAPAGVTAVEIDVPAGVLIGGRYLFKWSLMFTAGSSARGGVWTYYTCCEYQDLGQPMPPYNYYQMATTRTIFSGVTYHQLAGFRFLEIPTGKRARVRLGITAGGTGSVVARDARAILFLL